MSITISGTITLENYKGTIFTIDVDDLGFEIIEAHNNENGLERTHQGKFEDEGFEIDILVYEKPEGILNDVTVKVAGGRLLSKDIELSMTK
jgi:hypothetical protein